MRRPVLEFSITVLLSFFFCSISLPAVDVTEKGRPYFRIYNDRDGVPEQAIQATAIDQQGYIWIGTQGGAAYYNGRKWITVNMPDRTVSNSIFYILPASDGSLWFARNQGGISVLKENTWLSYDTKSGLPDNDVHCLMEIEEDGEPAIWAGTRLGLARFRKNRWDRISSFPNYDVRALLQTNEPDGSHIIWAGAYNGGLGFLKNNQWSFYNADSGLPNNFVTTIRVATDEQNREPRQST